MLNAYRRRRNINSVLFQLKKKCEEKQKHYLLKKNKNANEITIRVNVKFFRLCHRYMAVIMIFYWPPHTCSHLHSEYIYYYYWYLFTLVIQHCVYIYIILSVRR